MFNEEEEWLKENQEYEGQYEEDKKAIIYCNKYYSKNIYQRLAEGLLRNTFYKLTYKKGWVLTEINGQLKVYIEGKETNKKVKRKYLLETCWDECDINGNIIYRTN